MSYINKEISLVSLVVSFTLFEDLFSRLVLLFCCIASVLCEFLDFDFMGRSFCVLMSFH